MSVVLALAAALAGAQATDSVDLSRRFTAGSRETYAVTSHLLVEEKAPMLATFMPMELDMNYGFTVDTLALGPRGTAEVRYRRPSIVVIEGQTSESAPKKQVKAQDNDFRLFLSPTNEVLLAKSFAFGPILASSFARAQRQPGGITLLTDQLRTLALFVGEFDTSLDFSPKLPYYPVKVGDSWHQTLSYQPRELTSKAGTWAIQRLDATYKYAGQAVRDGKPVRRIVAEVSLDEDVTPFVVQLGVGSVTAMRLRFSATITFDLDPATHATIFAEALSKGGSSLEVAASPGSPIFEDRFTGRTQMKRTRLERISSKS